MRWKPHLLDTREIFWLSLQQNSYRHSSLMEYHRAFPHDSIPSLVFCTAPCQGKAISSQLPQSPTNLTEPQAHVGWGNCSSGCSLPLSPVGLGTAELPHQVMLIWVPCSQPLRYLVTEAPTEQIASAIQKPQIYCNQVLHNTSTDQN